LLEFIALSSTVSAVQREVFNSEGVV
jgi:hypothetical protein